MSSKNIDFTVFSFLNRKSQKAKKSLDLVFTLVFRNLCYTMKNELCKWDLYRADNINKVKATNSALVIR